MKKLKSTTIKLNTLNQITTEFINKNVEKSKGLIKVTTESYYKLYEANPNRLKELAFEWFEKYASQNHAYRDGSKLPWVNLVKVEIIDRGTSK
jgi:hypothetical protein